ncbi:MAG: tetratricopeptide repeat protein [Bacteroidota bacterium]
MTSTLSCPHCGSPISIGDKFCANCGKQISSSRESSSEKPRTVVCPTCGRVNSASEEVCIGCGSLLVVQETMTEKTKESASQLKQPVKKKKGTVPQTRYVLMIFAILAVLIVVLEYRNAPKGSMQNRPVSRQQEPQTDPSVLNEIRNLEVRVKANPNDSEALLQLANRLHDAKFYPRAIETYKQFLLLQPNNADARVDMAICYFETGDTKQAVSEIESVLQREPTHQMAAFNLGVIQLSSGNLPEAKKWLKKAVDIDSLSPAGQRARELLQQH